MTTTAFQDDVFQNDAFQIYPIADSGFAFQQCAFDSTGFQADDCDGEANRTGTGWDNYVAPRARKTLKQYKKEYLELSYLELEEEKAEIQADIKLAEQDIRFNVDLGLTDVIERLKTAIEIAKVKLQALEWVEKERIKRYKRDKQRAIDADMAFVAAYMMDDEDD